MRRLVFHHDPEALPAHDGTKVPVLLYGGRPPREGTANIGGPVLDAVRRLGVAVPVRAFDFVTIAMAVTAADTFVDRATAADGWCRELHLRVPLVEPDVWTPHVAKLKQALHFLSGDMWTFEFTDGGRAGPEPQKRGYLTRLQGHDCASLFSGGLDSAVGVLDLVAAGRRPLLVSHAYPKDANRQCEVQQRLPVQLSRFAAVAHPLSLLGTPNDVQMRTRSFNFLAYGTLVGTTQVNEGVVAEPATLFVPENGLIAINPPLTKRRIGALSTRTTHPHFLALIQEILTGVGLPVVLTNPYAHRTKGEMMRGCQDATALTELAPRTVSCGKWKRSGRQCGRCVPCLIRRAAFLASGVPDDTAYEAGGRNLATVLDNENARDDVLAMLLAVRRLHTADMRRWVALTGPLPPAAAERVSLVDVVRRGLMEVEALLAHHDLT